jgi:hypothetical protein
MVPFGCCSLACWLLFGTSQELLLMLRRALCQKANLHQQSSGRVQSFNPQARLLAVAIHTDHAFLHVETLTSGQLPRLAEVQAADSRP